MNKIFLLIGLLVFSLNCTAENKSKVVKTAREKTSSVRNSVLGIRPTIVTTKSGYKFWYLKTTGAPQATVHILFRNVGSAHQPFENSGLPALYANSIWCGAGEFKTRTELLAKESELMMGVHANSNSDNLWFNFTTVTVDKNDMKESFKIFLDILFRPRFNENEVKTERDDLSALISNSNYAKILPLIFPDHPYSWGKEGSIESLQKISIQDLKNFGQHFLTKDNASIYIGGDISSEEASAMCEQIFTRLPEGKIADNLKNVEPHLEGSISKYYTNDVQSTINFIIKGVPTSSVKEQITAKILFRILGGAACFKSRIMSVLRSQKGLIYSGWVQSIDYSHTNLARGYLFVDNDKVDDAVKTMREILSDLCEHGVTKEELDFFKSNLKGSVAVKLRTSKNLHRFFTSAMEENKPVSVLDDFIGTIDKITLKDVNDMAKRLLKDVRFVIIGGKK